MATLTEQVRQGAEQAWVSLAEGWRDLRTRASGALTHFRRDERAASDGGGATPGREGPAQWGLLAADIRLDGDQLVVRLEAPGMRREDLRIEVDADRLCVSGEKRVDSESREGGLHLVQCAYGSFRRELQLPLPVDAERAAASYRDGVLRITVPRLASGRGRRIAVHGA
jgi:HSP20 family protein